MQTRPNFRPRGMAGAQVDAASRFAADPCGLEAPVIVAETDCGAGRLD
jgi:hypothetical protein